MDAVVVSRAGGEGPPGKKKKKDSFSTLSQTCEGGVHPALYLSTVQEHQTYLESLYLTQCIQYQSSFNVFY